MRFTRIRKISDLEKLIEKTGFLPFFANRIEGFSIEENIDPSCWFADGMEGAWKWKGDVIKDLGCAYGKFFGGKAGYISRELYPDFANFRRDGYDFDARYDDGLARFSDKEVYEIIEKHESLMTGDIKRIGGFCGRDGKKGFDGIITRLQSQGYVVIADFEYKCDKNGETYGWGVARYATPERLFGEQFTKSVYKNTPEQSEEILFRHLSEVLSDVDEAELRRFLKR